MNPAQVKRAANMLRAYSEELSNHGCNDYPVSNDEEGRALDALVNEWYDDEDAQATQPAADGQLYLLDWAVACALADVLDPRNSLEADPKTDYKR